MKVIERHEKTDKRLGRFTCWSCQSIIETELDDIQRMKHHTNYSTRANDPREPDDYWTIPCPVCDSAVSLLYPTTA